VVAKRPAMAFVSVPKPGFRALRFAIVLATVIVKIHNVCLFLNRMATIMNTWLTQISKMFHPSFHFFRVLLVSLTYTKCIKWTLKEHLLLQLK
jgi:hypothetical protein